MVRVAGLKRRIDTGIAIQGPSGLTPRASLEAIWSKAYELQLRQADLFSTEIQKDLEMHDIFILRWTELTDAERKEADRFFDDKVFPILKIGRAHV